MTTATEPGLTHELILARLDTVEGGPLRRVMAEAVIAHRRGEYSGDVTVADAVRLAVRQLALTVYGEAIVAGVLREEQ